MFPTGKSRERLGYILFAFGAVNFIAEASIYHWLGGSAFDGRIENSTYFIGRHGIYTAVDPAVYFYSLIHGLSLLITHPLAILGAWFVGYEQMQRRVATYEQELSDD